MYASATILAEHDGSRTRLTTLRSDPPLVIRQSGGGVYLVGGAAGPLGGDELSLCATVGSGASLQVRSAAAALAQPGPRGDVSMLSTTLAVGDRAELRWLPEPLISVVGSEHHADTTIEVTPTSRLAWTEEFVLGRHREASGVIHSSLRVIRERRDIVHHQLSFGGDSPDWCSAAVLGTARAVVSRLIVGPHAADAPSRVVDHEARAYAAWFPLACGVAVSVALGPDLGAARQVAARLGGL